MINTIMPNENSILKNITFKKKEAIGESSGYCSKCGRGLVDKKKLLSFCTKTGKKNFYIDHRCPKYSFFRFKKHDRRITILY